MQLDYEFIKDILNTMQERQSHYIAVSTLAKEVKPRFEDSDERDYMDRFFGHLHILKDCRVIEEVQGRNLGISYCVNDSLVISGCYIRLTSVGYDLAKALNTKDVVAKLKRATLKECIIFCEALLARSAERLLDLV